MNAALWTLLLVVAAAGADGSRPSRTVTVPGGPPDTLVADASASRVRWRATAFDGHTRVGGSVRLANGMMVLRHEMLTSGSFTIDMGSVTIDRGPDLRESGRYGAAFEMKRYPTAMFTSSGMERVGPSRWHVSGSLAMHGRSQPLSFDADVRWVETGHLVATSTFTIDRQRWGIAPRDVSLANRMVDDVMEVTVTLDAHRKVRAIAQRP